MSFKQLLDDLNLMVKANGGDADDATIRAAANTGGDGNNGQGAGDTAAQAAADTAAAAAAAAAAGAGGGEGGGAEGGAAGAAGEGGEGGEDGDPLAKALAGTEVDMGDGTKGRAIDADALVKALVDRVEASENQVGEVLAVCSQLLKSQAAQITELTESVKKLAATGTGRKTVLTVTGKNTEAAPLNKSAPATMNGQEFLAKAETAFNAQKIDGRDLSLAEACINRGEKVPARIIQAVMAEATA